MIVHFGEYLPFTLLFTVNGSIISQIAWKVLFAFSLGVVVCSFWHYDYYTSYKFSVFTPMGVAISLFLGFRNNACYARWWEVRIYKHTHTYTRARMHASVFAYL